MGTPHASQSSPLELARCPHPLVEEVYAKRRLPTADGGWKPMDIFIPREEGDYLYSLVRHLRPALTVEVGMANGLSTLFLAAGLQACGGGRHLAIDPFQTTDWHGAGRTLLERAGLSEFVEVLEKPSHQALPEIEQAGRRAQLIFIDGSHLFDYVIADFLVADRILDVDGLLAFDDSDWAAITQAIRFIVQNRHYEVAFPEVLIETDGYHPTMAGNLARNLGRAVPAVGAKLRPDFLTPSFDLGIRGRCVVLRKLAEDDRDSQSRYHQPF
jgi:predicted O-methyltransferase YrrM